MSSTLYKSVQPQRKSLIHGITSYVQGALNAHAVHIVLSLSMCINVVQTTSLLYGE